MDQLLPSADKIAPVSHGGDELPAFSKLSALCRQGENEEQ